MKKLVRDRIPEIIKKDGRIPKTRVLTLEEYQKELFLKLKEEVEELIRAENHGALIEELADVSEVLDAIGKATAISKAAVADAKQKKREDRGGFEKRIYLEEII